MSLAAAIGLVVLAVGTLLLCVLVLRLHALLSLLLASLLVAVVGGIPLQDVPGEVQSAMGGTLGYIALVIGLGAIFGEMLERSGAARRIALTLLDKAGEGGAPAAFAFTGLVVAIPVFFDVAFIVLVPLLFHTARRTGRTVLLYALPLLAGLAVAHAFVPPTPGPVAVAGLLGADLGWVIVFGLAAGIPALVVAGLVFGVRAARRAEMQGQPPVASDGLDDVREAHSGTGTASMPGFGLSLSLILLPLSLIVLATASTVLPVGDAKPLLQLIGHPFSALLFTLLVASWLLGRHCGWTRDQLRSMANRSLQPVGLILLITGAGGVLGKTLLATGAGTTLANALGDSGLPIFVLAFLLALVVRVAQGSATVSMVTAAGLMAPILDVVPQSAPALGLLTVSIAAGATALSHVNDSGFWLVSRYLHLDERQTLLTWTPLTALVGGTGLAVVLLLAPFFAGANVAAAEVPPQIQTAPAAAEWLEPADPEFHRIVPRDAEIEVLGTGYTWSEGPVWVRDGSFLLFSDVPEDTVYRWHPDTGISPWLKPSGLTTDGPRSREPGANGLVIDAQGRLVLCQHGDRRVARLTEPPKNGPWLGDADNRVAPLETLAATFRGKRFHSPNDLVIHPNGDLYFTDPPYGLAGGPDSEYREMDHNGVYRLTTDGKVELLYAGLSRPNGIILSPDGSTLFVANSDPERAIWMSWPIGPTGAVGEGSIFYDATELVSDERPGLPDGMAMDQQGHLFATGPGGLWVFAPDGRHLGTLRMSDPTANCTFGDEGRSLFVTSNHRLLRIRLNTMGLGFSAFPAL